MDLIRNQFDLYFTTNNIDSTKVNLENKSILPWQGKMAKVDPLCPVSCPGIDVVLLEEGVLLFRVGLLKGAPEVAP